MSPADAPLWCRRGYELPRSSETVVIDGLGHTLRIALTVMRTMNPEVNSVVPPAPGSALRVRLGGRVLQTMESLLCQLLDYRMATEQEERRSGGPPADDDIPF